MFKLKDKIKYKYIFKFCTWGFYFKILSVILINIFNKRYQYEIIIFLIF